MTDAANSDVKVCPDCGAELAAGAAACWLCRGDLNSGATRESSSADANPFASPRSVDSADGAGSFSPSTLMLIVALCAVLFGLVALAPGLGIAAAVLSVPALVRTVGIQRRRRVAGAPLSPADKGAAFLASLTVVTVIVVAAGAAFVAICFPVGLAAFGSGSEELIWVGVIFGTIAGLVAAFFLARWLWPAAKTWHRAESDTEQEGEDDQV